MNKTLQNNLYWVYNKLIIQSFFYKFNKNIHSHWIWQILFWIQCRVHELKLIIVYIYYTGNIVWFSLYQFITMILCVQFHVFTQSTLKAKLSNLFPTGYFRKPKHSHTRPSRFAWSFRTARWERALRGSRAQGPGGPSRYSISKNANWITWKNYRIVTFVQ